MQDIEEFQEKKKKLFKNKDRKHTLSELHDYVSDLEVVCVNERSSDLVKLLLSTITQVKSAGDEQLLFKLYLLYFHQIFHLVQMIEEAEEIIKKMEKIANKSRNPEHQAYVLIHKSIISQLRRKKSDSINLAIKAMEIIKPYEKKYPNTYYRILYTYTLSMWYEDNSHPKAVDNFESCLNYWYSTYNTSSMIRVIFWLLYIYNSQGKVEKTEELLNWILEKERIQDNLIDSHFTLLYAFLGKILVIRLDLDRATKYLSDSYNCIIKSSSQYQMMYDYIEVLKMLSRCYAFKGKFKQSYNLLIEFLNFVESDFVKKNHFKEGLKWAYFNVYYTLLFIFVQLDLNISSIEDDKLKNIHSYTKTLLEESNLYEDILLDSSLDEQEIKEIINKKKRSPDELYLTLHQQIISLETHSATEETIQKIRLLKNQFHNPLAADIVVAKIHLAMGNFSDFNDTVNKINLDSEEADTPILQIWLELFQLLSKYLENPEEIDLQNAFIELENKCNNMNFIKMKEEVSLYRRLITSTRAFDQFSDKFKQTAFTDIYTQQSKKMVFDYLEVKEN